MSRSPALGRTYDENGITVFVSSAAPTHDTFCSGCGDRVDTPFCIGCGQVNSMIDVIPTPQSQQADAPIARRPQAYDVPPKLDKVAARRGAVVQAPRDQSHAGGGGGSASASSGVSEYTSWETAQAVESAGTTAADQYTSWETAQAVASAGTAAADEYTSLATRAIEECTDAKPLSSAVVIRASVDRAVSLQGSGIAGSTKPYTAFEVTVVVGRLPAVAEDVGHWTLQKRYREFHELWTKVCKPGGKHARGSPEAVLARLEAVAKFPPKTMGVFSLNTVEVEQRRAGLCRFIDALTGQCCTAAKTGDSSWRRVAVMLNKFLCVDEMLGAAASSGAVVAGMQRWAHHADGQLQYEGQLQRDLPEGQGTMLYADGSRYEGHWKEGKRDGEGAWTHPDGSRSFGAWKGGMMEGEGVKAWPDCSCYQGEVRDSLLCAARSFPRYFLTSTANMRLWHAFMFALSLRRADSRGTVATPVQLRAKLRHRCRQVQNAQLHR